MIGVLLQMVPRTHLKPRGVSTMGFGSMVEPQVQEPDHLPGHYTQLLYKVEWVCSELLLLLQLQCLLTESAGEISNVFNP